MGVSAEAKEALATLRDLRFARSPAHRVGALSDVTVFVTAQTDEPAAVYRAVLQLVVPSARRYHDRWVCGWVVGMCLCVCVCMWRV